MPISSMSLIVPEYTTLEAYLDTLRSPTLQRSIPNFDTLDTPPPLVDIPETPVASEADNLSFVDHHPSPALSDLCQLSKAAAQIDIDEVDASGLRITFGHIQTCSHDLTQTPNQPSPPSSSMYDLNSYRIGAPVNQDLVQQALTASRKATATLNDALLSRSSTLAMHAQSYSSPETIIAPHDTHGPRRAKRQVSISVSSLMNEDEDSLSQLSIKSTSPPNFDTRSLRPTLPALHIGQGPPSVPRQRHDSTSSTPTLSSILNRDMDSRNSHGMPQLINHQSQSSTSSRHSPEYRQTLPPLEIALQSGTVRTTLPEMSSTISRHSPNLQYHNQGLSPGLWSYSTPTQAQSPQRLPTNPAAWRMDSHGSNNSSNSGSYDQLSGRSSNSLSTPATGPSPPPSSGQYSISDEDSLESESLTDAVCQDQLDLVPNPLGYPCPWPGCNSPPFQTQYLLNSHQNVHSNQRPHFCPVESCPRGPGGQGFKRKNEMIR